MFHRVYSSFFFLLIPRPPTSTLLPYTTLFRSTMAGKTTRADQVLVRSGAPLPPAITCAATCAVSDAVNLDRKSTRLNSSHLGISYAVFCLKKKKKKKQNTTL